VISTAWHIFCAVHSVNNEKEHLTFLGGIWEGEQRLHDDLFLTGGALLLLACDLNYSILFGWTDLFNQNLVLRCDDLVQSELKTTNQIMLGPIFQIVKVINIVDSNFELLLLFEFVRHVEALDPFGIEIVHDDLCHAQHLPHVSFLLLKDAHTISTSECVQIWQSLTTKRQSQSLTQMILTFDHIVRGCQNRVVQVPSRAQRDAPSNSLLVLVITEARHRVSDRSSYISHFVFI